MNATAVYAVALLCLIFSLLIDGKEIVQIPDDLLLGTSTSAYQVEGAWSEEGKSESIWDYYTHNSPQRIEDRTNGDIACDSYHKVNEDVAMLKDLGAQFYRLSLSWCRILPTGFSNRINPAALSYYNALIDKLLSQGIVPMVTIYHFDLPQALQNLGGFANPSIAEWFEDYARVVYSNFGDRVKTWITINEPKQICHFGYGLGYVAPGFNGSGISDYLCARNVLRAHARAYHLYDREFRAKQKGKVGLVNECPWSKAGSNKSEDIKAANRWRQFDFEMYTHPVFSRTGDYPKTVKHTVAKRSKLEGFSHSRLGELTKEEVKYIQGTSDFFGLNHYMSWMVKNSEEPIGEPSHLKDRGAITYQCDYWLTGSSSFFKLVPWGLRKVLKFIKKNYGNPDVYITENGFPDWGELEDTKRIKYIRANLETVIKAKVEDKVSVKAYAIWSAMDDFEWVSGYSIRFGLYHVDFNDPDRKRTPKASAKFFQNLIKTRQFERASDVNDTVC